MVSNASVRGFAFVIASSILIGAACHVPVAKAQPTPPPSVGGVDDTVLDQYPDFVSLPALVLPAKGELPAQYLASAPTPFTTACDAGQTGTPFTNSEVEPHVAINPANPNNLIGAWQQDRWSNGGARGVVASVSFDGGITWIQRPLPFSKCGGGTASNGGNYFRATDPWVTFSPNGTAYIMALAFNGASFQAGSLNVMLVSRSLDGGLTWSNPVTLISDGPSFFNDKNTVTADPLDSNYVYATWDRLTTSSDGPTYFARTVNGGATWQTARVIYNPGTAIQTIGNVIVVRPDGGLVNVFVQIDNSGVNPTPAFVAVIRSNDKGTTWSPATKVGDLLALGARDPENGTTIRDGSIIPQIAVGPTGLLHVVWQDSRFSGGQRDGIAMSTSSDGGITWAVPVRVNGEPSVQAFMPTVHVSVDGTIGVSYYDLRSNTADPATLLTDYWLTRSTDGVHWSDSRVSPPFDLSTAPFAGGLFVGDYQGLVSRGSVFVPFFVRTNSGNFVNRTDVYAAPALFVVRNSASYTTAGSSQPFVISADIRHRVDNNVVRNLKRRMVGRRDPASAK